MKFALWAYPWDLLDEGVHSVAQRCHELGVDELNLATNYHSVQPFLPHNPDRKTFFAHASSYFHPDQDRYGQLSPVPNEQMGTDDWLAQIDSALAQVDVTLNSWTVGCHSSRLGAANPDLALQSPFDDRLLFGLCPSQPAVQTYLTGLLSDLDARAGFERIELETFDYFYRTGFGWHHDKYHLELGCLGEFLFGLCFCDACREIAAESAIDVDAARQQARDGVRRAIAADGPPDLDPSEYVDGRPDLSAYVDRRTRTLTDLYGDLRATVGDDTELGRYAGFLRVEDAWMHGADLNALSQHLDYHTVIAYEHSRQSAIERVRTADELVGAVPLHAGVLPGHPEIHDRHTVVRVVDGLASAGVDRISFYNYGLLPERNLDWVGEAIDRCR